MTTPSQIEQMALTFTRRQSEALAALELPRATDIEMFEMSLDIVADNLPLCERGWDLFASTARLDFYGINEVEPHKRRQWAFLGDDAAAALYAAAREDELAQVADYRRDQQRDERVSA